MADYEPTLQPDHAAHDQPDRDGQAEATKKRSHSEDVTKSSK